MSKPTLEKRSLADAFVEHNGPALATLIRILGDFDLAEDALQEAWISAAGHWAGGLPSNPTAWLITTARRKALDRLRREAAGVRKIRKTIVLARLSRPLPMTVLMRSPTVRRMASWLRAWSPGTTGASP